MTNVALELLPPGSLRLLQERGLRRPAGCATSAQNEAHLAANEPQVFRRLPRSGLGCRLHGTGYTQLAGLIQIPSQVQAQIGDDGQAIYQHSFPDLTGLGINKLTITRLFKVILGVEDIGSYFPLPS